MKLENVTHPCLVIILLICLQITMFFTFTYLRYAHIYSWVCTQTNGFINYSVAIIEQFPRMLPSSRSEDPQDSHMNGNARNTGCQETAIEMPPDKIENRQSLISMIKGSLSIFNVVLFLALVIIQIIAIYVVTIKCNTLCEVPFIIYCVFIILIGFSVVFGKAIKECCYSICNHEITISKICTYIFEENTTLSIHSTIIAANIVLSGCYYLPFVILAIIYDPLQALFIYSSELILIASSYLLLLSICYFVYILIKFYTLRQSSKEKLMCCFPFKACAFCINLLGVALSFVFFLAIIVVIIAMGGLSDFEALKEQEISLLLGIIALSILKLLYSKVKTN